MRRMGSSKIGSFGSLCGFCFSWVAINAYLKGRHDVIIYLFK